MEIKAVACTLPNPDYFLVFHSHTDARKAVWTREDRGKFFQLREALETLHKDPDEVSKLTRDQREALMPEGVSLSDALQSLTPCLVDANRATKNASYLHRKRDRAEIAELTGISKPHGIRFVAIVKGATGLKPKDWLLENILRTGRMRVDEDQQILDSKGEKVDLNSLEFRSSKMMVTLARRYHNDDCLLEGRLKVVALPIEEEVKLSANKGGEVVVQIAQQWS